MSAFLDWNVAQDAENIRPSAVDLRGRVAERIYAPALDSTAKADAFIKSPRTYWRQRVIDKAELFLGSPISGRIIEIGAGTAWCSALLSQREHVEQVFALDYDVVSVQELMPRTFKNLGADETKITRVLGSYNKMRCSNDSLGFVVSIGALHHSENLGATLRECYRVLEPGGVVLASEPCEYNDLTREQQKRKENALVDQESVDKLYGDGVEAVRKIDNSDHYYRLLEYEYEALQAGFDVSAFVFDATRNSGGFFALSYRYLRDLAFGDKMFKKGHCYNGFSRVVAYPYFARNAFVNRRPVYDPLLLLLKKPAEV